MAPAVTTLGTIRTTIRQRADQVNSNFLTDAELNGYIASSHQELYGILCQKFGNDYFFTTATFVTDGINNTFALAADFFKLLGVDLQIPGLPNRNITLRPFTLGDRNKYFLGNPIPQTGLTVQYLYVPRLTTLVNDSDTLDGVNGWEEYIVNDVVIKANAKEETDTSPFERAKGALIQRIEAEAENRDAGSPAQTVDAYANDYGMGWSGSYFPAWSAFGLTSLKYRLRGNNLWLIPIYGGGQGM